jgi:hypothetical protein
LKTRRYLLIALLASSLAAVPAARAASASTVISDCTKHLRLTQTYTVTELQNALRTIPADIQEYSNCHDVIQRALLAAEGKLKGGSASVSRSSSGSALPTPVIVVLVVLVLAAVTLAAVAIRRRRSTPAG